MALNIWTKRNGLRENAVTFTNNKNHIGKIFLERMYIYLNLMIYFWWHVIVWKKTLDSVWETFHNIIWYSNSLMSSLLNCKTRFYSFLYCSTTNTLPKKLVSINKSSWQGREWFFYDRWFFSDFLNFSLLVQLISILTIAILKNCGFAFFSNQHHAGYKWKVHLNFFSTICLTVNFQLSVQSIKVSWGDNLCL